MSGMLVGSGGRGSVSVGAVLFVDSVGSVVGSVDSVIVVDGSVSGPRFFEHEDNGRTITITMIIANILGLIFDNYLIKTNFIISNCISYFPNSMYNQTVL